MKKLAVLLPTYNYAGYIRESIQSILDQTYTDFDLYVYDDGSTDETEALVRAMQDDRIFYRKNPTNLGLSRTLNKGIDELGQRYEYIARMDADDLSLPERFEKQMIFLEQNPAIGMCGTQALCFKNEIPDRTYFWEYPLSHHQILLELLFSATFWHPSIIFRAQLLTESGIRYSETLQSTEDWDLWIRLSAYTTLANLPDFLMKYRVHEASNHRSDEKRMRHFSERAAMLANYWNKLTASNNTIHALNPQDIATLFYPLETGAAAGRVEYRQSILKLIQQMNTILLKNADTIPWMGLQLLRILDRTEMSWIQKWKYFSMLSGKNDLLFIKRFVKKIL